MTNYMIFKGKFDNLKDAKNVLGNNTAIGDTIIIHDEPFVCISKDGDNVTFIPIANDCRAAGIAKLSEELSGKSFQQIVEYVYDTYVNPNKFCNKKDYLVYKVITESDDTRYIKIWFSDNPPADENNPGCIGIDLYNEKLELLDGGELDYTSEDINLSDMINDCIEFMGLYPKSVELDTSVNI